MILDIAKILNSTAHDDYNTHKLSCHKWSNVDWETQDIFRSICFTLLRTYHFLFASVSKFGRIAYEVSSQGNKMWTLSYREIEFDSDYLYLLFNLLKEMHFSDFKRNLKFRFNAVDFSVTQNSIYLASGTHSHDESLLNPLRGHRSD